MQSYKIDEILNVRSEDLGLICFQVGKKTKTECKVYAIWCTKYIKIVMLDISYGVRLWVFLFLSFLMFKRNLFNEQVKSKQWHQAYMVIFTMYSCATLKPGTVPSVSP